MSNIIEQLSFKNNSDWFCIMQVKLMKLQVWYCIHDELAKNCETYVVDNNKAKSLIIDYVNESKHPEILSFDDAKDVWNYLQSFYSSKIDDIDIVEKIAHFKLNEDKTLLANYAELNQLFRNLKKLSDLDDFKMVLFGSIIKKQYAKLVPELMMAAATEETFRNLLEKREISLTDKSDNHVDYSKGSQNQSNNRQMSNRQQNSNQQNQEKRNNQNYSNNNQYHQNHNNHQNYHQNRNNKNRFSNNNQNQFHNNNQHQIRHYQQQNNNDQFPNPQTSNNQYQRHQGNFHNDNNRQNNKQNQNRNHSNQNQNYRSQNDHQSKNFQNQKQSNNSNNEFSNQDRRKSENENRIQLNKEDGNRSDQTYRQDDRSQNDQNNLNRNKPAKKIKPITREQKNSPKRVTKNNRELKEKEWQEEEWQVDNSQNDRESSSKNQIQNAEDAADFGDNDSENSSGNHSYSIDCSSEDWEATGPNRSGNSINSELFDSQSQSDSESEADNIILSSPKGFCSKRTPQQKNTSPGYEDNRSSMSRSHKRLVTHQSLASGGVEVEGRSAT